MTARSTAAAAVRAALTFAALFVVGWTIGQVEAMPAHLPWLLTGSAFAIGFLWRLALVASRRSR